MHNDEKNIFVECNTLRKMKKHIKFHGLTLFYNMTLYLSICLRLFCYNALGIVGLHNFRTGNVRNISRYVQSADSSECEPASVELSYVRNSRISSMEGDDPRCRE